MEAVTPVEKVEPEVEPEPEPEVEPQPEKTPEPPAPVVDRKPWNESLCWLKQTRGGIWKKIGGILRAKTLEMMLLKS